MAKVSKLSGWEDRTNIFVTITEVVRRINCLTDVAFWSKGRFRRRNYLLTALIDCSTIRDL